MGLAETNSVAAQAHIRRIVGPTILMGDGSYFDYDDPAATTMTIEDYAWGLLKPRFSGQTRSRYGRCLYFVLQHVCLMAEQMRRDGQPDDACYAGLMHESDEVVSCDMPGPIKGEFPALKMAMKRWAAGIDQRFSVNGDDITHVIKHYDLRMLATEKRDVMVQGSGDHWSMLDAYPPFDFVITPWPAEQCVAAFLKLFESLTT